jgi:hypothetical protein
MAKSKKVRNKSDSEIRAEIKADPDLAPELDEAWFAKAVAVAPKAKRLPPTKS